jgi:acyl carrier protein
VISNYISSELIGMPEMLPLKNDTPLLESGLLDSLTVLKLVLFLEQQFGIVVGPEELIPENFETINAIDTFLRTQHQVQV